MNEAKRNAMVGGFMVVGLIFLGWLFWIFGEAPEWLGTPGYKIAIDVIGLYGVTESTVVELNGVPVGRVTGIQFKNKAKPRDVQVVVSIDNEYDIPQGVVARIQPGGFGLARGRVSLIPRIETENAMMRDGSAVIKGTMVSAFSDVISDEMLNSVESAFENVGKLAESLVPAAEGVQKLVEQRSVSSVDNPPPGTEQLTANIATLIERFDSAIKAFNETFGNPDFKKNILASLENINQVTEDGRAIAANLKVASETLKTDVPTVLAETKATLVDIKGQVNAIGQKTIPVLENLDTASGFMYRVARDAAEGNGTIGLLLRDPRLYESMTIGVQRLTDLIDTLRRMAKVWEEDNSAIRIRGAPL